jgi:hypothetical protein
MKSLVVLVVGTLALWVALIYPGWLLWGEKAWVQSVAALGLCLLPALATYLWVLKAGGSPEMRMVVALGGSGIRIMLALGGGFLLYNNLPSTFTDSFWAWMAVFYLFVLALEIYLVVTQQNSPKAGQ